MTLRLSWTDGFTAIELLVVVFIISVLALTAIPVLSRSTDREAEMEGGRIESAIHHAKALAISRDAVFRVVFDIPVQKIRVRRASTAEDPTPSTADNYNWPLEHGTIVSADFGGVNKITFNDDGVAVDGGSAVIDYGDLLQTIAVTKKIGLVTITEAWK